MQQSLNNNQQVQICQIYSQQQNSKQQQSHLQYLSVTTKSDDMRKNQLQTEMSEQLRHNVQYLQSQVIRVSPSDKEKGVGKQGLHENNVIDYGQQEDNDQQRDGNRNQDNHSESTKKLQGPLTQPENIMLDQNLPLKVKLIYQETSEMSNSIQPYKKLNEPDSLFRILSQFKVDDMQRDFVLDDGQRGSSLYTQKQLSKQTKQISQEQRQKRNNDPSLQVEPHDSYEAQELQDDEYQCQEYDQNQEQFYQNDDQFDQQQQERLKATHCQSQRQRMMRWQHRIKVIKQLPKQVIVQAPIQSLIMSQVPKGLKIACIFKIQSKFMGMSTQYDFILKSNNRCVLSSKKEHFSFTYSKFIISLNQNYITKRGNNPQFIGRLEANFTGSKYQLYLRWCLNKDEKYDKQVQYKEELAAEVGFEKSLLGGGRKMQVIKLDREKLGKNDLVKGTTLQDVLERKEVSKLLKMQTQKPNYDRVNKRYSLDFGGKAKVPSARNVILTPALKNAHKTPPPTKTPPHRDPACLLIAKQSQQQYLVQICHPFSIYQAFGVCLANTDTKLLIS